MTDELDYYKRQLGECIAKIPASISTASIQKVRAYKAWAIKAQKLAANRSAKVDQIRSQINEYRSF